jgi:hypothetical protein
MGAEGNHFKASHSIPKSAPSTKISPTIFTESLNIPGRYSTCEGAGMMVARGFPRFNLNRLSRQSCLLKKLKAVTLKLGHVDALPT